MKTNYIEKKITVLFYKFKNNIEKFLLLTFKYIYIF